MRWHLCLVSVLLASLWFVAGCAPAATAAIPRDKLVVSMLYPTPTSSAEMGQTFKGIVRVVDGQGNAVGNAQVALSVIDPSGTVIVRLPATFGSGDVYRTSAWLIPHKLQQGEWTVRAEAESGSGRGEVSAGFHVNNSVSEDLLGKYGFWVAAPALRSITPSLVREQGDAQNGVIIWGGVLPSQHIFPENWLDIEWREGDFKLTTGDQVRAFMLGTLGDLGFSPVRDLGPFEKTQFKSWDAWKVKARGQFSRYDEQWIIFYAPEAGKTYAIGTTVVQPPTGIDPHAALRDSFELHPEIQAKGVASEPLPRLVPAPELISPELGSRVFGTKQPIVLSWAPVKNLAADEYYRVSVDYNYEETNPLVEYATRETHMVLPVSLYDTPNCGVFNWQVTLMHQTGVTGDGQPEGTALSYPSFYRYVEWYYPSGTHVPFNLLCPNPQT